MGNESIAARIHCCQSWLTFMLLAHNAVAELSATTIATKMRRFMIFIIMSIVIGVKITQKFITNETFIEILMHMFFMLTLHFGDNHLKKEVNIWF